MTANVHAPDRIDPRGWRLHLRLWFAIRLPRFVPHAEHGDQDQAGADDEEDADREENGIHRVSVSVRQSVSQCVALVPEGAIDSAEEEAEAPILKTGESWGWYCQAQDLRAHLAAMVAAGGDVRSNR